MAALVHLWDLARSKSNKALREYVRWEKSGTERPQLLVSVALPGWIYTTFDPELIGIWERYDNAGPALWTVHVRVNQYLRQHVAPKLLPAAGSAIRDVADCLLGALYASFALEIAGVHPTTARTARLRTVKTECFPKEAIRAIAAPPAISGSTCVRGGQRKRRPDSKRNRRRTMAKRRGLGEGAIYQREDGLWVGAVNLGWVDGKRRRKTVAGKTRQEVQGKAYLLTAQKMQGIPPADDRLTVEQFLNRWLEQTRNHPSAIPPIAGMSRLSAVT